MKERNIKSFFKQQVRMVLDRSASEPEGFVSYFKDREPKDEEILGLLAVSTMINGEFHLNDSFPTPVEALAAISDSSRSEICAKFRKELRSHLRQLSTA